MIQQIFFNDSSSTSSKMDKADTISTTSCESYADKEMQLQIVDEESLQQVYNELKVGAYQQTKKLEVVFRATDAYRKISKLRRLDDVFKALGSLPLLEELVFTKSDLLVSSVVKLLKKSSLKSIKFHQCVLIAKKLEATEKLWQGLALQRNLTCLEVLACHYTNSETLCRDKVPFTYSLPAFVLQSSTLRRLVLDDCQLDSKSFTAIVQRVPSLQELEIRPVWQAAPTVARRQQYQTKKRAIREFLMETIPQCLAQNTTLQRLVVSIEDYHLEQVYVEAMATWIELVQYDNSTLQDLRLTHRSLWEVSTSQDSEPDWDTSEAPEDYAESYLHYNLRSILQLNQIFAARLQRQRQEQTEEQQQQSEPSRMAPQSGEEEEQTVTEIWV